MAPGGGPRDSIPPALVKSIPPRQSLNYNGNSVKLTFNEYLKINNLNKQLIITPIIDQKYETKIRKYSIELIFPEPFRDSTTYTFNFREAIQDITEGNVTKDNVIAFSTGNYIDSIYITGKVNFLFNDKPAKDFVVCLYQAADTLNIFNGPPVYLTITNDKGAFRIENIKTGFYRLYAYSDQNSNLRCDIPRETFGYKTDTLNLYNNIDSTSLNVQYVDMSPLKIQRAGPAGLYYEIKLNKNVEEYDVIPADSTFRIYNNFAGDRKTIRMYNTLGTRDSLEYFFHARDSINQILEDTLYLKFIPSKRKKEDLKFSFLPKSDVKITDDFHGIFNFNKPVVSILPDSLYFQYDSVTFQNLAPGTQLNYNKYLDKISFDISLHYAEYLENLAKKDTLTKEVKTSRPGEKKITPGKSKKQEQLVFHIGNRSFVTVDRDTVKQVEYYYSLLNPENFGIIRGSVTTDYQSYKIELLDKQFNIVDTVSNQLSYIFRNIKPGEYIIRVFVDNNNNGRWDPGNIFKNIPPEDVYIFPDKLTLRANWELTDINLEF